MGLTPLSGFPFPDGGDPVDVAGDIEALAIGLDPAVIVKFNSLAERDAWAAPTGSMCWVHETIRHYRRLVNGTWESIPLVVSGVIQAVGDAFGNYSFGFARPFPFPPVVLMNSLDYGNVATIPFNITATGTQVGLRRPADNSAVVGIAIAVGYIAVLN